MFGDTVDGQNPASPRMMIIPLFIGFQVTLIWCFGLVVWCSAKMSFSGPKKTTNAENMIQSRENDEKT